MQRIHNVFFVLFLSALIIPIHAQSVTPLHQYMNAHSIIATPSEFREMQDQISARNETVSTGVQLTALREEVDLLKSQIFALLAPPIITATASPNNTICVIYNNHSFTIIFKGDSIYYQFDGAAEQVLPDTKNPISFIREKLTNNIASDLDAALTINGKKAEIKALLGTMCKINQSGGTKSDELDSKGSDTLAIYSQIIAEQLVNIGFDLANTRLQEILPSTKTALITDNTAFFKFIVSNQLLINNYLNETSALLKEQIDGTLNQAQDKLEKLINNYVSTIFGASTGVAVAKGQGAFDGGFFINMKGAADWRVGLYFNANINKADTTQPTEMLIGTNTQFTWGKSQFDILASCCFRNGGGTKKSTYEVGVGAKRDVGAVLLGLEGYTLKNFEDIQNWIIGFSFTGKSSGAPSILLGASFTNKEWTPIFQTAVPILGN